MSEFDYFIRYLKMNECFISQYNDRVSYKAVSNHSITHNYKQITGEHVS